MTTKTSLRQIEAAGFSREQAEAMHRWRPISDSRGRAR